jgi:hypothetical protein
MRINWVSKQIGWAYENLCKHLIKKMPNHKHIFNSKNCDVNFVVSPGYLRKTDLSNTVLHVDSNRWYEESE